MSSDTLIESMNASVARSARGAPCGPNWSAIASALARESSAPVRLVWLILGRLSTVADFDYRACAEAAIDGFLATHAKMGRREGRG
jgi:hypothetical protein